MIRINLLAPEFVKKEERKELLILAYAVVAVIVLFGMGKYTLKLQSYSKLETRLAVAKKELGKYENIVKQVDALQATKNVLETKKTVISNLMAGRLLYPRFMEEFMELIPASVWLKSLATQLQSDGKMKVTINAESLDNFAIADFITALSSTAYFSDVELGPITTAAQPGKASTSVFSATLYYQKKKL